MNTEWKKRGLVLLLLAQCFVTASAQQADALNADELIFQEAINRRMPFYRSVGLDDGQLDLKRIEAFLSEKYKSIGPEVKGNALAQAASVGDEELVALLIAKGANVNHQVEEKGQTVLMRAAASAPYVQCGNDPLIGSYPGHSKVVKRLLDAGARVNDQDAEGNTALMLAAGFGRIDSVKRLLEAGANVRLSNQYGWTALIYAANSGGSVDDTNMTDIVKELLAAGADVNVGDLQGKTALDYCSQSGAIAKLLIDAGAIKPTSHKLH